MQPGEELKVSWTVDGIEVKAQNLKLKVAYPVRCLCCASFVRIIPLCKINWAVILGAL